MGRGLGPPDLGAVGAAAAELLGVPSGVLVTASLSGCEAGTRLGGGACKRGSRRGRDWTTVTRAFGINATSAHNTPVGQRLTQNGEGCDNPACCSQSQKFTIPSQLSDHETS